MCYCYADELQTGHSRSKQFLLVILPSAHSVSITLLPSYSCRSLLHFFIGNSPASWELPVSIKVEENKSFVLLLMAGVWSIRILQLQEKEKYGACAFTKNDLFRNVLLGFYDILHKQPNHLLTKAFLRSQSTYGQIAVGWEECEDVLYDVTHNTSCLQAFGSYQVALCHSLI